MAHINHAHRHGDRVGSQPEDYCTYITRLEKKTSMMDGPHFGNMQHAFKRVEVYEEVDEEYETEGPFGRAKHMGRVGVENKGHHHKQNTCEEAETETVEYIERKQDFRSRAK
ncbi:uncharacterized protein LOC144558690 [Carex rostrata]